MALLFLLLTLGFYDTLPTYARLGVLFAIFVIVLFTLALLTELCAISASSFSYLITFWDMADVVGLYKILLYYFGFLP
jgi:hypothetical protein